MKIILLDKVDSTNDYVKKFIKNGETVAVAARRQTKGKGTKGRSFVSDEGGVYVSVLRFYNGLKASEAYSIVSDTAVAVVNTLRAFGVEAFIKWPNDVFAGGKKICGILTETTFFGEYVGYGVIGIGININNNIAPEIRNVAVSAKEITGREIDVDSVLATLLYNLEQKQEAGLYARYSCVLGKTITVTRGDGSVFQAVAESITEDGRLRLDSGEVLSSAEIRLTP